MKSILIVEDDITYGMILKTWLGKKGFQVSSASSIARAQKHIEAETVDLILSDLRLPDRDGIDLLKWLGEHSLHIPLIIIYNNTVCVDFNEVLPNVTITLINESTSKLIHSEAYNEPTNIDITLDEGYSSGNYLIKIESDEVLLYGYFSL